MAAEVAKAFVWEDSGAALMARVLGNAATAITQATVSSVTRKVFDLDGATPTTPVSSALTVSTVVFDTLQTDGRWATDSTGYNFLDAVDDDVFTTGGNRYRVEYVFEPSSGAKFHVVFEVLARPVVVT